MSSVQIADCRAEICLCHPLLTVQDRQRVSAIQCTFLTVESIFELRTEPTLQFGSSNTLQRAPDISGLFTCFTYVRKRGNNDARFEIEMMPGTVLYSVRMSNSDE
jgi:hypothetical protein